MQAALPTLVSLHVHRCWSHYIWCLKPVLEKDGNLVAFLWWNLMYFILLNNVFYLTEWCLDICAFHVLLHCTECLLFVHMCDPEIEITSSFNKSSAVADMGDRARAKWAEKWGGLLCSLFGSPHLTQCRLGWGLSPYQVVSGSMQLFGHHSHGLKSGGCCAPFRGWGSWSPSNTMLPTPRPTSVPSGILMHPAVWPQQTWAEKWGGCCAPFRGGAGFPSNTTSPRPVGRGLYHRAK